MLRKCCPFVYSSATLRKIYNICEHVIDIPLRFRPNIPLSLRQSSGFGRSCNFYIRSTTNPVVVRCMWVWAGSVIWWQVRAWSMKQDPWQWSFRKTGTMGMLQSQVEICVWVQAPERFCGGGGPGLSPAENFLRLYVQNPAISCIFGRKTVRSVVLLMRS